MKKIILTSILLFAQFSSAKGACSINPEYCYLNAQYSCVEVGGNGDRVELKVQVNKERGKLSWMFSNITQNWSTSGNIFSSRVDINDDGFELRDGSKIRHLFIFNFDSRILQYQILNIGDDKIWEYQCL